MTNTSDATNAASFLTFAVVMGGTMTKTMPNTFKLGKEAEERKQREFVMPSIYELALGIGAAYRCATCKRGFIGAIFCAGCGMYPYKCHCKPL